MNKQAQGSEWLRAARRFPRDFVWGAATSAYQIEGASSEDGRGRCIWDAFAETPGAIADGSDGATACDHYHRVGHDVALMRELGLAAYRFSIAWPRVLPAGTGPVNKAGLAFYDRLTDALLEVGIVPWVTLYHWDLPQVLQDRGGWPSRDTVAAFTEFADVVTRHLGDRVQNWFTINEPMCVAHLGYQTGEHAPGMQDWPQSLAAAHHVLLAHGTSVPIIRANVPDAQVGIVLNLTSVMPASPSDADAEAARYVDGLVNRWYLDPLYGRGYPRDMVADYGGRGFLGDDGMDFVRDGDFAVIAAPTDLLGVNYYSRALVRSEDVPERDNAPRTIPPPPASALTDMGWEVYPEGIHDLLVRLHQEYPVGRLVVAENGAAYPEGPDDDGRVRDLRRIRYYRDHLEQCLRAIDAGVPLAGYFAWSLMDNFEWAFGYTKRFGLVWVDFATQERVLKDSARWYAATIRNNGPVDDVREGGPP